MTKENEIEHLKFLFDLGGFSKIIDYIDENITFDIKYGTDTSNWLPKNRFNTKPLNIEHGIRYRAAATSKIENALSIVSNTINTNNAGFYDLGCGKGKVLCIAGMQYNYDKLIGIDYYSDFLKIADKNLGICNVKNVHLLLDDMTNYTEFKETSVVFLYNPADDIVLNQVRDNLQKHTKKCVLIYIKPLHENIFKDWKIVSKTISKDLDHCTTILTYGI